MFTTHFKGCRFIFLFVLIIFSLFIDNNLETNAAIGVWYPDNRTQLTAEQGREHLSRNIFYERIDNTNQTRYSVVAAPSPTLGKNNLLCSGERGEFYINMMFPVHIISLSGTRIMPHLELADILVAKGVIREEVVNKVKIGNVEALRAYIEGIRNYLGYFGVLNFKVMVFDPERKLDREKTLNNILTDIALKNSYTEIVKCLKGQEGKSIWPYMHTEFLLAFHLGFNPSAPQQNISSFIPPTQTQFLSKYHMCIRCENLWCSIAQRPGAPTPNVLVGSFQDTPYDVGKNITAKNRVGNCHFLHKIHLIGNGAVAGLGGGPGLAAAAPLPGPGAGTGAGLAAAVAAEPGQDLVQKAIGRSTPVDTPLHPPFPVSMSGQMPGVDGNVRGRPENTSVRHTSPAHPKPKPEFGAGGTTTPSSTQSGGVPQRFLKLKAATAVRGAAAGQGPGIVPQPTPPAASSAAAAAKGTPGEVALGTVAKEVGTGDGEVGVGAGIGLGQGAGGVQQPPTAAPGPGGLGLGQGNGAVPGPQKNKRRESMGSRSSENNQGYEGDQSSGSNSSESDKSSNDSDSTTRSGNSNRKNKEEHQHNRRRTESPPNGVEPAAAIAETDVIGNGGSRPGPGAGAGVGAEAEEKGKGQYQQGQEK